MEKIGEWPSWGRTCINGRCSNSSSVQKHFLAVAWRPMEETHVHRGGDQHTQQISQRTTAQHQQEGHQGPGALYMKLMERKTGNKTVFLCSLKNAISRRGIGSLGLADANYYMYVWMNHFAVHQKLTQHCKSTILQYKIN